MFFKINQNLDLSFVSISHIDHNTFCFVLYIKQPIYQQNTTKVFMNFFFLNCIQTLKAVFIKIIFFVDSLKSRKNAHFKQHKLTYV